MWTSEKPQFWKSYSKYQKKIKEKWKESKLGIKKHTKEEREESNREE